MRALPGLAPLRHRDFALYWVGQLVSLSGTWIELTATSWLLYQLTSSPLLLGVNGLVRAVPIIGLSLFGGAIALRIVPHVASARPSTKRTATDSAKERENANATSVAE